MSLPRHITHYYEAERGPFLNICDLSEKDLAALVEEEKAGDTAFNRFAMGDQFIEWRRAADDMLIRAYSEKFGFPPIYRPFFAVLGSFDRTLTMFRSGAKVRLELEEFQKHEVTFMYPDHAHLTQHYGIDIPHLFYQRPNGRMDGSFWGRIFTFDELLRDYENSGIRHYIELHRKAEGWAGCYVEAHIWCRDHRTNQREQVGGGNRLKAAPHL